MYWNTDSFNLLLENFSFEEEKLEEPNHNISNFKDFLALCLAHMKKGEGGGGVIENEELALKIESAFDGRYSIGGTSAQGAACLSSAGYPCVMHMTDRNPKIAEFLGQKTLRTVKGDKLVRVSEFSEKEFYECHYIFQFDKGSKIRYSCGGKMTELLIPQSNRIILDFDDIHSDPPLRRDFFKYCENNCERILTYNFSGFNAIEKKKVYEDFTSFIIAHFRKMKNKNHKMKIYLEAAHYNKNETLKKVMRDVLPEVDVFGMNEEELKDISGADVTDIEKIPGLLRDIRKKYSIKTLCLHTRAYSLFSNGDFGFISENKDALTEALIMGNTFAGAKCANDRYPDFSDCRNYCIYPVNTEGEAAAALLNKNEDIISVPALTVDIPKTTNGLGDSFAAGIQSGLWKVKD